MAFDKTQYEAIELDPENALAMMLAINDVLEGCSPLQVITILNDMISIETKNLATFYTVKEIPFEKQMEIKIKALERILGLELED